MNMDMMQERIRNSRPLKLTAGEVSVDRLRRIFEPLRTLVLEPGNKRGSVPPIIKQYN